MTEAKVEDHKDSIKDQLIDAVISLADPLWETPGTSVKHFLSRPQFQETYREVLLRRGSVIVDGLLANHKDQSSESLLDEVRKCALWMAKGREAFELILDYKTKTDTDLNMMNFWKMRGVVDETMEPEKYQKKTTESSLPGLAGSLQAHPVSKQQKEWFLLGGFSWALVRGQPAEAINCLEDIAQIKGVTINPLISDFEPDLSFMHRLVEDLDQDVVNTKGGLDVIGGRPAGEYLLEMDQAMMKRGYMFDENHSIKPLPIAIK